MANEKEVNVAVQVNSIEIEIGGFLKDAKKIGNKSAARRARKSSLEITKMLKDYRKKSLK